MNKHNERAELTQIYSDISKAKNESDAERGELLRWLNSEADRWDYFGGKAVSKLLRKASAMLEAQPDEQAKGHKAVAKIERRFGGVRIVAPNGEPFDMARFVGSTLYTAPPAKPAREWVGLEPIEIKRGREGYPADDEPDAWSFQQGACWAESKLREKNAGLPAADKAGGDDPVAFSHYKVVVDALSNLLGQVEKFCVENGEADFETGEALRAMEAVCEYENTRPQPQAEAGDFTDTSREALCWVLWHHQGASSKIGEAMRFALGIGRHERMSDAQVAGAKRWAALGQEPQAAELVDKTVNLQGSLVDKSGILQERVLPAVVPDDIPAILKKQAS